MVWYSLRGERVKKIVPVTPLDNAPPFTGQPGLMMPSIISRKIGHNKVPLMIVNDSNVTLRLKEIPQ